MKRFRVLLALLLSATLTRAETCAPSCPVYPTGLEIPSEFQQAAKDIDGAIVNYLLNTVQTSWSGSAPGTLPLLGAELTTLDVVSLTSAPSTTAIDNQLAAFNYLGIKVVKSNLHHPLILPALWYYEATANCPGTIGTNGSAACLNYFYQDATADNTVCGPTTMCGKYVASITHAISQAHGYGMKFVAQSQAIPRGSIGATGSDPLNVGGYYDATYVTPDNWAQYTADRAAMTLKLAQLGPDFCDFSSEPDNEGLKTGVTELLTSNASFQTNYATLITAITTSLTGGGISHTTTKYVAGLGNWTSSTNRTKILTVQLANSAIDIIDIHAHVINDCANPTCSATLTTTFLANMNTIFTTVSGSCTAGCPKGLGMDEDFPYFESNAEEGSGAISTSEVDQRDVMQFLTPVHEHYIQAMTATAYWKSMAYVSFSDPTPLWAYDSYFSVLNTNTCQTFHLCWTPTNYWANNSAVSAAMSAHTPTLTGSFLASVISGGIVKDTVAPTAPGNLQVTRASSTDVTLTWNASTDSVGVLGYKIYRDGTWIATALTANTSYATTYEDKWSNAGAAYVVHAIDAAGNESGDSTTGGGGSNTATVHTRGTTRLRGRDKFPH